MAIPFLLQTLHSLSNLPASLLPRRVFQTQIDSMKSSGNKQNLNWLPIFFRKQSAAEQNRKKVKSKSLKTINIEERAIEELKAMYAEKFPYDIITVKRAHLDVSAPVWTKS